jgi:hypothetical protein
VFGAPRWHCTAAEDLDIRLGLRVVGEHDRHLDRDDRTIGTHLAHALVLLAGEAPAE